MPRTAVLFSGGLDSAVLLARELEGHEAQRGTQPIHVRAGSLGRRRARTIQRILSERRLRVASRGDHADLRICATCIRRRLGHHRPPPAYDTPTKTSTWKAATRAHLQGRGAVRPGSIFSGWRSACSPAIRSRRDARIFRRHEPRDVCSDCEPADIVAPLASNAEEDLIRLGRRSACRSSSRCHA